MARQEGKRDEEDPRGEHTHPSKKKSRGEEIWAHTNKSLKRTPRRNSKEPTKEEQQEGSPRHVGETA